MAREYLQYHLATFLGWDRHRDKTVMLPYTTVKVAMEAFADMQVCLLEKGTHHGQLVGCVHMVAFWGWFGRGGGSKGEGFIAFGWRAILSSPVRTL